LGVLQRAVCKDEQIRRALIVGRSDINGIDYVVVDPASHAKLTVHFLNPVGPKNTGNPNDTDDEYGLSGDLSKIAITGGTRIVGILPIAAVRSPDGSLTITVNEHGDYSVYTLALNVPALDRLFASIDFSFMATCPVDFDCRIPQVCPPRPVPDMLLDYEAKDYASFRQLLLDLLPRLNPTFIETNPSDLGIALVELLAYAGDRLSYFQDAVANEAYLDTIRHRISARRLAKLVDYRMHDGRNAWAAVHLAVSTQMTLPLGTKVLSRIGRPLVGETSPPPVTVDAAKTTARSMETDPALTSVVAFETAFAITLDPVNNEIHLHTWGDEECCLPRGTTEAFLYAALPGSNTASVPVLHRHDYLLIEEVLGPLTGAAADADPTHRQVIMIDQEPDPPTSDPLFSDHLLPGGIVQERISGDQPLPVLRVRWRTVDRLNFPFCLSAKLATGNPVRHISVMRGNMVLADHGLTTDERIVLNGPVPSTPPFRPRLSHGPLTQQMQPASVQYDSATGRIATARTDLTGDVSDAQPAISLSATLPTGTELWTPVPDLLESTPFDTAFVAEIDNDQRAVLRFGDDEYGQPIAGATAITATYRVGNGLAGNVGAEALAHVALAPVPPDPPFLLVRNPLPARDGTDPETIAEVQQRAPEAFRAVQFRAVTEADFARTAKLMPQVLSAVASFRWTGSWYTVFIGILPSDPADLINEAKGVMRLSPALTQYVARFLEDYRLAGYDLEIRPPQFLALEIDLLVCAASNHFRSDVAQAVEAALSNRELPDGSTGFFSPGKFVFGEPVYLSQIYAAVQNVEGVDSVVVTRFAPFGQPDNGELARGIIPVGPWQIARLDNDPNFMERGVLKITMRGGKL
jgi:hypothetical protein